MNEQKEMELPAEPEWMGMGSREGTCQASVCSLVFVWSQQRFGVKVKVMSLTCVRLFVTPRTVAHQTPPSLGFSRQDTGVGCHILLQEIFLTQELNSNLCLLALADGFLTTEPP